MKTITPYSSSQRPCSIRTTTKQCHNKVIIIRISQLHAFAERCMKRRPHTALGQYVLGGIPDPRPVAKNAVLHSGLAPLSVQMSQHQQAGTKLAPRTHFQVILPRIASMHNVRIMARWGFLEKGVWHMCRVFVNLFTPCNNLTSSKLHSDVSAVSFQASLIVGNFPDILR